jgi:RecB family endonuclease NucS
MAYRGEPCGSLSPGAASTTRDGFTAHLPTATRLIMIKADGTVLIHADSGTKALNWMSPGSRVTVDPVQESDGFDGGSYQSDC